VIVGSAIEFMRPRKTCVEPDNCFVGVLKRVTLKMSAPGGRGRPGQVVGQ